MFLKKNIVGEFSLLDLKDYYKTKVIRSSNTAGTNKKTNGTGQRSHKQTHLEPGFVEKTALQIKRGKNGLLNELLKGGWLCIQK